MRSKREKKRTQWAILLKRLLVIMSDKMHYVNYLPEEGQ